MRKVDVEGGLVETRLGKELATHGFATHSNPLL
jgi:hypothetical protein